MTRKHSHYFKDVSHLSEIDVYRTLERFGVTDQALGHAIKKLLVAGGRGDKAIVSTFERDIKEAIDTLQRKLEMMEEDKRLPSIEFDFPLHMSEVTLPVHISVPPDHFEEMSAS